VQVKAKAPDVPEEVAIEAAIKGLSIGPFAAHLAREKPTSMQDLYQNLKSIADQTTTSARDWKSKTRISNKETTGIHKGITEAKGSSSRGKAKANKFSILSNRAVVSKDRRCQR
jgi:hypothetical protein